MDFDKSKVYGDTVISDGLVEMGIKTLWAFWATFIFFTLYIFVKFLRGRRSRLNEIIGAVDVWRLGAGST